MPTTSLAALVLVLPAALLAAETSFRAYVSIRTHVRVSCWDRLHPPGDRVQSNHCQGRFRASPVHLHKHGAHRGQGDQVSRAGELRGDLREIKANNAL